METGASQVASATEAKPNAIGEALSFLMERAKPAGYVKSRDVHTAAIVADAGAGILAVLVDLTEPYGCSKGGREGKVANFASFGKDTPVKVGGRVFSVRKLNVLSLATPAELAAHPIDENEPEEPKAREIAEW